MRGESLCDFDSDRSFFFNLRPSPDTELHDDSKLFRQIVPSVDVARPVRRQKVILCVLTAMRMRGDVVGVPSLPDSSSADVAAPTSLLQDPDALLSG